MSKARNRYRLLADALQGTVGNVATLPIDIDLLVDAVTDEPTGPPWDCACCQAWLDTMRARVTRYALTDPTEWDLIRFETPNVMPDHLKAWMRDN